MIMQKNYAVYLDGNIVGVTMNEKHLEEIIQKLKEKYPKSNITYSYWYD